MYLDDPRENRYVDADGQEEKIAYWRMFDNRPTQKYQWGALQTDLDGLSPEEYAKTIFVVSGTTTSGSPEPTPVVYYTTSFYKPDGKTLLYSCKTASGNKAQYGGASSYSSKTSDNLYVVTNTITGWTPSTASAVTGDTNYTASTKETKTAIKYTITFKDGDGKNVGTFSASGNTPLNESILPTGYELAEGSEIPEKMPTSNITIIVAKIKVLIYYGEALTDIELKEEILSGLSSFDYSSTSAITYTFEVPKYNGTTPWDDLSEEEQDEWSENHKYQRIVLCPNSMKVNIKDSLGNKIEMSDSGKTILINGVTYDEWRGGLIVPQCNEVTEFKNNIIEIDK